jgi:hypothetical protein
LNEKLNAKSLRIALQSIKIKFFGVVENLQEAGGNYVTMQRVSGVFTEEIIVTI